MRRNSLLLNVLRKQATILTDLNDFFCYAGFQSAVGTGNEVESKLERKALCTAVQH